jgi:UDP-perosamine 4-acetyltransferase
VKVQKPIKFFIIGAGKVGRLVADVVQRVPDLKCTGFLDRDPSLLGKVFYGIPVIGNDDQLEALRGRVEGALPVIGDLQQRHKLFEKCRLLGYQLVNVIDPSVLMASDVRLGEGIFISYGTILLTNVAVGDFTLVGTGVRILHDTVIGQNCVIGGGTTIGSSAIIGRNVSFGVGACVASNGKRIGNNVRVGAGSVILSDVPDNAFVLGNPARVIGYNKSIDES